MPGSPSNAPRRTLFTSGSSGLWLHSAPPQAEQKCFETPSGGSYARISSSPERIRSEPGAIRALAAAAVPVRRWQRVQWQYPAETSASVISNRTPPQRQPPVSGRSGTRGRLPRVLAQREHRVVAAEAEAVAQRDVDTHRP